LREIPGGTRHACTDSHTAADFLGFMKMVARRHRKVDLHVILDNSSTHSPPEVKAWLAKNPRIHFHYTPTSASWLNQVEGFFGILSKQSLSPTNFPSKKALRDHIERYITSWNEHPTPFIWTKPADALIQSHRQMLERISHAAHWILTRRLPACRDGELDMVSLRLRPPFRASRAGRSAPPPDFRRPPTRVVCGADGRRPKAPEASDHARRAPSTQVGYAVPFAGGVAGLHPRERGRYT
jgi:transposase